MSDLTVERLNLLTGGIPGDDRVDTYDDLCSLVTEVRRHRAAMTRLTAIIDPITDPVTPEATPGEVRDALIEIIHIVHPERALYAPRRQAGAVRRSTP